MANPFKFGTVVSSEFFTNRKQEIKEITDVLSSDNHLVLISPRRYGKTSLINKVVKTQSRPTIYLDLQLVTDVSDMAAQLMKRVLKTSKWESIKQLVANFQVVPTVSLNPLSDSIEISFQPSVRDAFTPLEDVLGLIEKIGERGKRPIVVLDEFQEVTVLSKGLPKQLRAVMQQHSHVNYIFLGSAESMMRQIFETKKSAFYHFGHLMTLEKIAFRDFCIYLESGFTKITASSKDISNDILQFTSCHPYYTQQLAYYCYTYLIEEEYHNNIVASVVERIVGTHSNDFERLWNTIQKTDKRILIALANQEKLSAIGQPTSTVYSGLARLARQGYIIKNGSYQIDDPFFKSWIITKREQ